MTTTGRTSGTWSASGTRISLVSSTGDNAGGPYCVQGNELHLITLDMTITMGSMGTLKIDEDLVATKQ
jgi:hypothetical protein